MNQGLSLGAKLVVAALGACAGLAAGTTTLDEEARACGGFFAGKVVPAIAVERVLLVFDAKRHKEHFIREVRFKGASGPFGFVVPSPSQPEVAKVEHPPFDPLLKADFGYVAYEQKAIKHFGNPAGAGWIGRGAGSGFGAGHGRSGGGVSVLSVERVGKFTAFVVRASDEAALFGWLRENHFAATASTKPWLAHYVELGFFFTAFRYDAPADEKTDELESEVIRLSFDTPVAYYPYLEPTHAPGEQPERADRLLQLWLVSEEAVRPVALHQDATDQLQYKRPWAEGMRLEVTHDDLAGVPDVEALLPEAPRLVVQTFEDAKISRRGWGDVLLAPANAAPLDDAARQARTRLLPLLLPKASE